MTNKQNDNKQSQSRTDKRSNVKIIFLHTVRQNSDLLPTVLIIFRQLLNINKAYIQGVPGSMFQTSGGCSLC